MAVSNVFVVAGLSAMDWNVRTSMNAVLGQIIVPMLPPVKIRLARSHAPAQPVPLVMAQHVEQITVPAKRPKSVLLTSVTTRAQWTLNVKGKISVLMVDVPTIRVKVSCVETGRNVEAGAVLNHVLAISIALTRHMPVTINFAHSHLVKASFVVNRRPVLVALVSTRVSKTQTVNLVNLVTTDAAR